MISRRRRLLWGALQGALETGVNMAEEARAYRRGYAAGARDVATALRQLLEWETGDVEALRDSVLDLAIFIEDTARPPARVIEGELVDVAG